MEPAYISPFTPEQHALLGELAAILGQADEIKVRTVQLLIGIDREAANLLCSTRTATNMETWSEIILNRTNDADILYIVRHAKEEA